MQSSLLGRHTCGRAQCPSALSKVCDGKIECCVGKAGWHPSEAVVEGVDLALGRAVQECWQPTGIMLDHSSVKVCDGLRLRFPSTRHNLCIRPLNVLQKQCHWGIIAGCPRHGRHMHGGEPAASVCAAEAMSLGDHEQGAQGMEDTCTVASLLQGRGHARTSHSGAMRPRGSWVGWPPAQQWCAMSHALMDLVHHLVHSLLDCVHHRQQSMGLYMSPILHITTVSREAQVGMCQKACKCQHGAYLVACTSRSLHQRAQCIVGRLNAWLAGSPGGTARPCRPGGMLGRRCPCRHT